MNCATFSASAPATINMFPPIAAESYLRRTATVLAILKAAGPRIGLIPAQPILSGASPDRTARRARVPGRLHGRDHQDAPGRGHGRGDGTGHPLPENLHRVQRWPDRQLTRRLRDPG